MKTTIFSFLLAFLLLSFFSCKKTSNNPPNKYPMQVRMTDTTGPYDAVLVDVKSVQVSSGNDSGWISLFTNAGIYDLTKLVNGVDTFLASGTLPSARISQIRLILGTNNSVVVNGTSYPLKTPSAQQSGLKLNVNYTMVAGINYVVLLDFDAGRSIVKEGNGSYLLKPVIRTTTSATNGAIKGIVTPASSHPTIYAINGADSFSTFSDLLGYYMFSGLAAGNYNVVFMPAAPYSDTTVSNVPVVVGKITDMGIIKIR